MLRFLFATENQKLHERLDAHQFSNPTRFDPFDDKDIALGIEAGVVGVNKTSRPPLGAFGAHRKVVAQDFGPPGGILAEMGNDLVVSVQQGHPCMEIGHQHEFPLSINIRWKEKATLGFQMLAVHVKPLESTVGPVGDHQLWDAVAIIQPLAMGSLEFAIRRPFSSDGADKLVILGVFEKSVAAVAITQVIVAIRSKARVGWAEADPGILKDGRFPLEGSTVTMPKEFTVERDFRKEKGSMVRRQIDELSAVFLADVNAVTSSCR